MTGTAVVPKKRMSPRKRAALVRYVQYAILVLLVVVLALVADWGEIRRAFLDLDIARAQFPDVIVIALKNTIIYTACGFAFGLALGLVLALMRLSSVGPYRWISTGIIELFRGLPALVVFLVLGLGLSLAFGVQLSNLATVTLALGLVGGAYMAETIRAGIQAVPKGQYEAARTLGMTHTRAMVTIALCYLLITVPLSIVVRRMEAKSGKAR